MNLLPNTQEVQSETSIPINFDALSKGIFSEKGNVLFIGGEPIKSEIKEVLKDQAEYLKTSQLYEILLATLKNEAGNLALIQSKDWDNVLYAKAMHHNIYVFENLIKCLTK